MPAYASIALLIKNNVKHFDRYGFYGGWIFLTIVQEGIGRKNLPRNVVFFSGSGGDFCSQWGRERQLKTVWKIFQSDKICLVPLPLDNSFCLTACLILVMLSTMVVLRSFLAFVYRNVVSNFLARCNRLDYYCVGSQHTFC